MLLGVKSILSFQSVLIAFEGGKNRDDVNFICFSQTPKFDEWIQNLGLFF